MTEHFRREMLFLYWDFQIIQLKKYIDKLEGNRAWPAYDVVRGGSGVQGSSLDVGGARGVLGTHAGLGAWVLGAWVLGAWVLGFGFWGLGFWGLEAWGLRGAWGLGLGAWGLGLGAWGLGVRWGLTRA